MPNSTIEPVLGHDDSSFPSGLGGLLWSGVVPLRLKLIDPVGSNVKVKLVVFDGFHHGCLWVVVVFRYFSTESLILAQDERWRRA
jgi:hypothetical protein